MGDDIVIGCYVFHYMLLLQPRRGVYMPRLRQHFHGWAWFVVTIWVNNYKVVCDIRSGFQTQS